MIKVNGLEYTYPGKQVPAVNNIEFEVSKGEIFGFLGPNGAGKSTTQKILIGLLKGYKGEVRVFDNDISDPQPEYYSKIGVAFEFPNLYGKFTALENLEFFSSLYPVKNEDPLELLKRVGLEKEANDRVSGFSKGMKMRLNYIRAFLHNPEVVFLDEPTSGLDPVNARHIMDLILEAKASGKTIFLTTHNMTAADQLCDRIAFMVEGKLKLVDSPRNLKITHGKPKVTVESSNGSGKLVGEFPVENLGNNKDFISFLKKGNVETIHTQEASLDEIFIKTTGRRLI